MQTLDVNINQSGLNTENRTDPSDHMTIEITSTDLCEICIKSVQVHTHALKARECVHTQFSAIKPLLPEMSSSQAATDTTDEEGAKQNLGHAFWPGGYNSISLLTCIIATKGRRLF